MMGCVRTYGTKQKIRAKVLLNPILVFLVCVGRLPSLSYLTCPVEKEIFEYNFVGEAGQTKLVHYHSFFWIYSYNLYVNIREFSHHNATLTAYLDQATDASSSQEFAQVPKQKT